MSVSLTLLGLLEREPSHGYDLKRDYDTFFGRGRNLPFGQVYSTLGRLARDGKVVMDEVSPGEGPERKRYVITELGATEVDTWPPLRLRILVTLGVTGSPSTFAIAHVCCSWRFTVRRPARE